jgi:hypothetical protein
MESQTLLQMLPLFSGAIGGMVGGVAAYFVSRRLDQGRRRIESVDVSESLYNEIADRAARCLNDHLVPWKQIEGSGATMTAARVAKFRPVDPVVYRAVATKLGMLPPGALFSVLQFYYRLDVIDREIDDIKQHFDYKQNVDVDRVRYVAQRFRESLAPALEALEKLGKAVQNCSEIDRQAASTYPHVKNTGEPLRSALKTAINA